MVESDYSALKHFSFSSFFHYHLNTKSKTETKKSRQNSIKHA